MQNHQVLIATILPLPFTRLLRYDKKPSPVKEIQFTLSNLLKIVLKPKTQIWILSSNTVTCQKFKYNFTLFERNHAMSAICRFFFKDYLFNTLRMAVMKYRTAVKDKYVHLNHVRPRNVLYNPIKDEWYMVLEWNMTVYFSFWKVIVYYKRSLAIYISDLLAFAGRPIHVRLLMVYLWPWTAGLFKG